EFASYWFPCYDSPNDKSTSEVLITVEEGFLAISNGKLLSVSKNRDKVTYHWKEETPHSSYLNSFVVGKFGVKKEEVDGISLEYEGGAERGQPGRARTRPSMVRRPRDLRRLDPRVAERRLRFLLSVPVP